MFEAFVVISSMYNFSKGWYTYLTLSVSTNVCCLPVFINLGKAARRPSIRDRVISTNCREIMAAMKNEIFTVMSSTILLELSIVVFCRV